MIELPLCAVGMIRIGSLPRRNTQNLDIKGCRSLRSVDSGLRPNASEISLPAPLNFPFGEDHVSSAIFVVLTLCTAKLSNVWLGSHFVNVIPVRRRYLCQEFNFRR